jgi:hypothetical protein
MRGRGEQNVPTIRQVRTVYDQRDFRAGPVRKRMFDDWLTPISLMLRLGQHASRRQTLDQVLAMAGHGQRRDGN